MIRHARLALGAALALLGAAACSDGPLTAPESSPALHARAAVTDGVTNTVINSAVPGGACADVWMGNTDRGAQLTIWPCHGHTNQQFTWTSTGELHVFDTMCVDDYLGQGNDGDAIVTWNCKNGPNQKWRLTDAGEIRGINDKCITVEDPSNIYGSRLVLRSCDGSVAQKWSVPGAASGSGSGTPPQASTGETTTGGTTTNDTPAPTVPTQTVPAPSVGSPAALPRAEVDVRAATVTGRSIPVAAGQDLQAALDAAQPGDELVLAAGATFVGNFTLRPKSGSGWVTIRSGAALPAAGTRVTPGTAGGFAKILTPNIEPALATAAGAHHIRLLGIEVGAVSGVSKVYSLLVLGDGSAAQTSLSQVPHDIIVDRVYVHGRSSLDLRRCIALNSASTAVVDSYLDDCHSNDGDSQAIHGSNGPGPFLIQNNYLAGGAENVMFGGDDPRSAELVPSDITIRGNDIVTPLSWKGVWVKKNLLELKLGKRVLVERNVFDGSWTSGQTGYAIVLWSVNQGGGASWSETSDVTVRHNVIRNSEAGFQLSAKAATSSVPMARVLIQDNDLRAVPARPITTESVNDLTIDHNTMLAGLVFNSGMGQRLTFTSNAIHVPSCPSDWGFCGSMFRSADGHDGDAATILGYHAPGATVAGNLIDGDRPSAIRTPITNGASAIDAGFRQ